MAESRLHVAGGRVEADDRTTPPYLPTPHVLKRFEAFVQLVKSFQSMHIYADTRVRFDWNIARLDALTLFTARNSRIALYVGLDPHTYFALPLKGKLTATYEDGRAVALAGRDVLMSRYLPARLDLSDGIDCVYVKASTKLLREWIAASEHAALADAELGSVLSVEDVRVAAFVDFLKRLGAELDESGALGGADRRRALAAEFRSLFLAGPVAALADRMTGVDDPHLRTVQAVAKHMGARLEEKFALADLSDVCGVSERSVQTAFNKRFGYSPWTYLRLRRLERARTLLSDPGCRLSVAEIAVESGFNHFGQFARDFREHFGETPKRTSFISRVTGNRWRATMQVAVGSTRSVRRYLENLLAG